MRPVTKLKIPQKRVKHMYIAIPWVCIPKQEIKGADHNHMCILTHPRVSFPSLIDATPTTLILVGRQRSGIDLL